ncbi:hypothetical protein K458DRAFT_36420 [Lentithecium fluviatile CBS 122367]|uniref:Uncharacterized protein n=1 Tax=Lentithecium fluviatile CBS 122367 TaxID=1168545 RepID=A0A6G1J1J6_9PLEO|nr:hypothetical protein K458DRAFT_36420 [Lentithecium fluviatile CBS 122367]
MEIRRRLGATISFVAVESLPVWSAGTSIRKASSRNPPQPCSSSTLPSRFRRVCTASSASRHGLTVDARTVVPSAQYSKRSGCCTRIFLLCCVTLSLVMLRPTWNCPLLHAARVWVQLELERAVRTER